MNKEKVTIIREVHAETLSENIWIGITLSLFLNGIIFLIYISSITIFGRFWIGDLIFVIAVIVINGTILGLFTYDEKKMREIEEEVYIKKMVE